jgi:toxin ParE1/3/4
MIPVRFSKLALSDLRKIAAHIAADDAAAAARVINRIEERCFLLGQFPMLGRPSNVAGARKLLVSEWGYIIIYEIHTRRDQTPSRVVILRVYHGARDVPF